MAKGALVSWCTITGIRELALSGPSTRITEGPSRSMVPATWKAQAGLWCRTGSSTIWAIFWPRNTLSIIHPLCCSYPWWPCWNIPSPFPDRPYSPWTLPPPDSVPDSPCSGGRRRNSIPWSWPDRTLTPPPPCSSPPRACRSYGRSWRLPPAAHGRWRQGSPPHPHRPASEYGSPAPACSPRSK